jgi:pimeloyl-ACP methyl ester carboxylesterase
VERKHLDIGDGGGTRRLSYLEAGARDNPRLVLCVHGLTRNGLDFEPLASALAGRARVVCPDVAGRGDSDPLADPAAYQIATYADDMLRLLDHLGAPQVDWVGTSMGGLIGMAVAASEDAATRRRVRRLVLNDIGPLVPKAALMRIGEYVSRAWRFRDLDAAEAHVRAAYAPFALASEEDWRRLTEISVRPAGDGGLVPNYDPAIGLAYRAREVADAEMWPLWDAIECPVLVLRGSDSDVLLAETAAEMTRRGPGAELVAFAGVGHAPALFEAAQIEVVAQWLARGW